MKMICYDDITGTGVAAQLTTLLKVGGVAIPTQKNWDTKFWQAVMLTETGTSRIGDANVSATNGIPIGTPNNGQFVPPVGVGTEKFEFSDIWVLIKSGDVMSVARWV